jgi:cell division protein FtsI (penicillin-binding protein 3)
MIAPAATLIARPVKMRRAENRTRFAVQARDRLVWVSRAFLLVGAVVLARLLYVALFDTGASARSLAAGAPARADIVDRNGVPMARTIMVRSIRVVPERLMNEPRQLAVSLNGIFPDTPVAEFHRRLTGNRSAYIRRRATTAQLNAVNNLAEIGFEYPQESERLYPQGALGAHVLGFANIDGRGVMGAEAAFDDALTADATRGQPFALSVDMRVQAALEHELSYAVTQLEAVGGAGLVMDAHSGEVLAMTSLPTFNPNRVSMSPVTAQRNAVTLNVYELGSTFKPLSFAAAIDAGVVTDMARRYDATTPLEVGGFRIRDSHSSGRWLNVPEALVHSSNIVTARVADQLGRDRMAALFRRLEFDSRPHIEMRERGQPLWPQSWGRTTTMTTAYGHGIAVTPLHLASAYAALVNGGIWRPATIRRLDENDAPQGRRVFSETTSARMRQLLRMIVADGTGTRADAPGYRVGGKTGSAEKPSAGGYARHSVVATFAGAFPMDNPRYVIVAMIDEPRGNAFSMGQRTAGYTAAPVVRRVVMRIGPMLGIYPDENRDVDLSELQPLLWRPRGER